MHQNPSPHLGSRKRDDFIVPTVLLAGGVGLYPVAMLGTAGLCTWLALVAGACFLALRRQRLWWYSQSVASTDNSLAQQVEQAQVNYRSIFDNAAQGIFQSTPQGSFITANPALARMFGMESPEALINEMSGWEGKHFFTDPVRWAEMIQYILWQDSVADFEAEVVRKDGRTIWISQNVHAIWDENDEIAYLEGTIFEITERHWAERRRALQYAAAKILNDTASLAEARPKILQTICELLEWEMGAVWDVVHEENILKCVEIWHRQGIDIGEFEEASLEITFEPGVRLAGKVWQTGEPAWVVHFAEEEFSLHALVAAKYGMNSAFGIPIKVGGEVMHVLEFFSPKASEPDPELLQMLGLVANQIGYLIERKLAEETLRETVVRKTAILESALDSIVTFDHEGRVLEWNPAAERTFGYRREDILGRPLAELILPEADRAGHTGAGIGLPLFNSGNTFGRRMEITLQRAGGNRFPAEIAVAKAQLHGRPLFTVYLRDITEVKNGQRLRNELDALLEACDDAIFSATADGTITSWNPGAERLLGYGAAEIMGRPLNLLVPPDYLEDFACELAKLRRGEPIRNRQTERLCKNGRRVALSINAIAIRDDRDAISGSLCKAREIAENKQADNAAFQSQKLEAVGRLAGGVAHDFNNILTAVLGYADLLLTQVEPGNSVYDGISEIRKAGQFAASLTQQLLAFSRGQALELKVLDLNETITGIEPMLRRLIAEPVQIAMVLCEKSGLVRADSGELEQVILNLALNARDAMPLGGVITIETCQMTISEETPALGSSVPPGNWVKLVVRDNGIGMDDAVKKHVFEPFFTTKQRGRGTGLGLATCYGIVKHSGGHILCNTAPGLGTTFQIFLPLVESA